MGSFARMVTIYGDTDPPTGDLNAINVDFEEPPAFDLVWRRHRSTDGSWWEVRKLECGLPNCFCGVQLRPVE